MLPPEKTSISIVSQHASTGLNRLTQSTAPYCLATPPPSDGRPLNDSARRPFCRWNGDPRSLDGPRPCPSRDHDRLLAPQPARSEVLVEELQVTLEKSGAARYTPPRLSRSPYPEESHANAPCRGRLEACTRTSRRHFPAGLQSFPATWSGPSSIVVSLSLSLYLSLARTPARSLHFPSQLLLCRSRANVAFRLKNREPRASSACLSGTA